jgi:hypothetical protein
MKSAEVCAYWHIAQGKSLFKLSPLIREVGMRGTASTTRIVSAGLLIATLSKRFSTIEDREERESGLYLIIREL